MFTKQTVHGLCEFVAFVVTTTTTTTTTVVVV